MDRKLVTAALVISIITLIISIAALVTAKNKPLSEQELEENGDIQYVLYLGTNDKDSNEPVYPPEEAKKKAEEILLDHFGGFTIQEAHGGWKDGDKVYSEYTIVIYLSDTNIDEVHSAAEEMVDTFHQSSVLIQSNETTTEFYGGE
ncbi:MAG: DUF3574 domain-containing protein [Eubacterium sp.]|nr:DUF3574 domain-containing protein [Eubacterium sp.]